MLELTPAVVVYCTLLAAVFLGVWFYYDRRDHARFEVERRKTTFHCIRCDALYTALDRHRAGQVSALWPRKHAVEILIPAHGQISSPLARPFVLLGLGVVLFAVSAKLALVQRYGTDQPYLDQWVGEGVFLVQTPFHEQLTFGLLLSPHGEHHPALMRLLARGLIIANGGQWDCYVELVASIC